MSLRMGVSRFLTNAKWILSKEVDDSAIADGKRLTYKSASGKLEYETPTAGDMLKSVYDTDDDGIVDNSEGLEGNTLAQVRTHSPQAHKTTHENGGTDEMSVAGLSGLLADDQNAIAEAGIDITAIHDNVASEISAIAEKVSPVSADLIIIEDSVSANAKKKAQIGNLPIFVSHNESLAESTYNTDTLYQQKLRLSFTSEATTYLILWSADITSSSGTYDVCARCQINDITTMSEVDHEPENADQWINFSGSQVVTLSSGTTNIDIDYRIINIIATAKIRNAAITVMKVA